MLHLELKALGPLAAALDSQPLSLTNRKAQALLAYLAVTAQTHTRDSLAAFLWPEATQARARGSLRQTLWALRQSGLAGWLTLENELVALQPGYALDVAVFRQNAARAAAHPHTPAQPCPECHEWLSAAVAQYRGDFLAGLSLADSPDFEDWQRSQAESLRQGLAGALERLSAQQGLAHDWPAAIETARRWVGLDPLHEPAQRALMGLYARAGQRRLAVQQYECLSDLLDTELGVEPEPNTQQLYAQIMTGQLKAAETVRAEADVLRASARPRHNLPAALTSFIGREKELGEGQHLLDSVRLLSLTGIGGTGKTRLALQLAWDMLDTYPGGVWLVELASLSDSALVPKTVVGALQLREQEGDIIGALITWLHSRGRILLVLDNCEHVLEACGELSAQLLAVCPDLQIMATSREVLGIPGEQAWPVPTLSLPPMSLQTSGDGQPLAVYYESEAVRLFVERAQSALPTFTLTGETAPLVAQITSRLEGLPLAIELAAARVRVLSLGQIASRLDDTFALLTRGSAILPPRQQTLIAVMDWSHDLLSQPERVLFRRLAVFAGGFTLEAAENVGSGEGQSPLQTHLSMSHAALLMPDILDLLSDLVDKSLVIAEPTAAGERRFRLLEPVRQYAVQHLEAANEGEWVREVHLTYFAQVAEQAKIGLRGPQQVAWAERVAIEIDNIRAALQWSLAGNPEAGVQLAGALWDFWYMQGDKDEGARWLQAFLASPTLPRAHVRAHALAVASLLMLVTYRDAAARALADEGIALARELGDRRALADNLRARALAVTDDAATELPLLQESLVLYRALDDQWGAMLVMFELGQVCHTLQRDLARAKDYYSQCLGHLGHVGDGWGMADVLNKLGEVAAQQGDWAEARRHFAECLALQRQVGSPRWIVFAMARLAWAEMQLGDFADAEQLLAQAADIENQVSGLDRLQPATGPYLAYLAWHRGDYQRAKTLYTQELAVLRERGAAPERTSGALTGLAMTAVAQADYAAARACLWEALVTGREMSTRGVVVRLEPLLAAAMLAAEERRPDVAATLLGAVLAVSDAAGYIPGPLERADWERCARVAQAQLDTAAFEAALAHGQVMSPEQATNAAQVWLQGDY